MVRACARATAGAARCHDTHRLDTDATRATRADSMLNPGCRRADAFATWRCVGTTAVAMVDNQRKYFSTDTTHVPRVWQPAAAVDGGIASEDGR